MKSRVHEVAGLVGVELVMGPERIIESEITMFLGIVSIEQPGGRPHHVYAQPAVEVLLPLVEWPHSDSNLDTHEYYYMLIF